MVRNVDHTTQSSDWRKNSNVVINIYVFKYNVSTMDGTISVRINIEITFIFRLHRCPIHLVIITPLGLSLTQV